MNANTAIQLSLCADSYGWALFGSNDLECRRRSEFATLKGFEAVAISYPAAGTEKTFIGRIEFQMLTSSQNQRAISENGSFSLSPDVANVNMGC